MNGSECTHCTRCGRKIPARRQGTAFCSDRCERQQGIEDQASADDEREQQRRQGEP